MMEVINVLRIIATVMLWVVMPFQWWSIWLCHKSINRHKQRCEELDSLIESYKQHIAEMEVPDEVDGVSP